MPLEQKRQEVELEKAAEVLRAGGLVAFPTETVYGLGADASNSDAVKRIFAAKGRPADHPVIVHLPSSDALSEWTTNVSREVYTLAETFWAGPLTLILKRSERVPDVVTGGQDTVGMRVPGHPLALSLLETFGSGLAAPSANRFGRISPTTAAHVRAELGDRVDMILDGGPCEVGLESTILDMSGSRPRLLRPGAVSLTQLAEVLGEEPLVGTDASTDKGDVPKAPGTLESHYAPTTPVVIAESLTDYLGENVDKKLAILARSQKPAWLESERWLVLPGDPAAYGKRLYAGLRELDEANCDEIIVEAVPSIPEWLAVRDRLRRAATKEVHNDGSF